ncbi:exonuclease subunit SbcD [Heliobacterium gestii]|uniref:Nuclease SbcCD subunit D n=1 Tax=Heliomicrobium gestii TaxID=2699 RepID=A0A845LE71_HELGE|nr:exonuclease subunit SbcD [Heliomicrobium gestii]MBM7866278.1 exonuclease SbcD [Heliomicrobium gestii]MZP42929.1 exonuclease subunit SbcD [Heliomicrobium gestii]
MRILHTSDWHLGKTLEGRDRQAEQEAFIDEICAICDREQVDLVLLAGDVYQHANPSAAAEELFYDAVSRLANQGRRGVVIIAGNHDNPERLCAAAPLADRHGITLLGLPKDVLQPYLPARADRVRRVDAGASWVEMALPGCDHHAVIAALPYPSEGRLKELLAQSTDDREIQKGYNERLALIFRDLSGHFRDDTVNLVMSHLYVRGGAVSDSENPIQVGAAYAVDPAVFPEKAQYVALGHLHRPQDAAGGAAPIRYAGSPLAYSFSEAGQAKSVTLVDLLPREPAQVREILLASGKPLVRWVVTGGMEELQRRVAAGDDANAWIDLELHLAQPLTLDEIGLIKGLHRGIVNIVPKVGRTRADVSAGESMENLSVEQRFIRFYQRQTGAEAPDPALLELFLELLQDERDNGKNPGDLDGEEAPATQGKRGEAAQ